MNTKSNQNSLLFILATLCLSLVACGNYSTLNAQTTGNKTSSSNSQTQLPALPPAKKIADGVVVHEVNLNSNNLNSHVWIYLPENPSKEKLPCILIAPAGSYLLNGTYLGEGSRPEHLPYVKAGYAVVAYEVDGSFKDNDKSNLLILNLITAIMAFMEANAGLSNEKAALDYALAKVPQIDSERIYAAGHSSAATLSLLVAANEPRIKAAVAYAPQPDIEKALAKNFKLDVIEKGVPGFKDFIARSSPKNNISKIKVPVFIFHANDDSVIATEDVETFVTELNKSNSNVTYSTVKTGNHYGSMIQEGIPQGIQWLNKMSKKL